MRQEWSNLQVRRPDGVILDFTIPITLKEGEQVPSVEEAKLAAQKCLILDYTYPLPQNYAIN